MAYVAYVGKMFWPVNLIPFYPHPYQTDQVYPAGLLAGLLLVAVTVLVLALVRRAPYLTVGWFWYLGTLVPVIGVVQVIGGQGMADRYTYIPLIGLFIALVWGVADGLSRSGVRAWVPAAVGAVVLAGCAGRDVATGRLLARQLDALAAHAGGGPAKLLGVSEYRVPTCVPRAKSRSRCGISVKPSSATRTRIPPASTWTWPTTTWVTPWQR